MEDLTIDREFDDLCPALTDDEERLLEQSLLADGCLHSIVLWANHDDTILDGHNRYRLCKKHGLKFTKKAIKVDDRDAAKAWIIRTQIGRRNLSESQRASLAAKLVNSRVGGDHSANLPNEITTAQAAEEFNVSERSVRSAKKVLDAGAKPLQKAVESGEVPVSVAAKVAELPKSEQSKLVSKGPKAVKAAAKKIDKPKQYKDEFDTAKIEKQKTKNGAEATTSFSDKKLDDLIGQVMRSIDERWNSVGGHRNNYTICVNAFRTAVAALGVWRKSK
jgi:hypothetical protein